MNLNLSLPPDVESLLQSAVASSGKDLEQFVVEAIVDKLVEAAPTAETPPEGKGWAERVRAWAISHPAVAHHVDDSREGIYSGR